MDMVTLRSLITVLMVIAFAGICFWAWSKKRRRQFEDAANLPFADEDIADRSAADRGGRRA